MTVIPNTIDTCSNILLACLFYVINTFHVAMNHGCFFYPLSLGILHDKLEVLFFFVTSAGLIYTAYMSALLLIN